MYSNLEDKLNNEPENSIKIIQHLQILQQSQKVLLNKGLEPVEFKKAESLVSAIDAAIKIIKKTKSYRLATAH